MLGSSTLKWANHTSLSIQYSRRWTNFSPVQVQSKCWRLLSMRKGYFFATFLSQVSNVTELFTCMQIYPSSLLTNTTWQTLGSNCIYCVSIRREKINTSDHYPPPCISYNLFIFCPIGLKFSQKFLHAYCFILSIKKMIDNLNLRLVDPLNCFWQERTK